MCIAKFLVVIRLHVGSVGGCNVSRNVATSLRQRNRRINLETTYKPTSFDVNAARRGDVSTGFRRIGLGVDLRASLACFSTKIPLSRKIRENCKRNLCALVSTRREMERPLVDRCKIEGRATEHTSKRGVPPKCRTVYIRIREHSVNCRS